MVETSKEERDLQRVHIGNKGHGGTYGEEAMRFINDAERCAELEERLTLTMQTNSPPISDVCRIILTDNKGSTRMADTPPSDFTSKERVAYDTILAARKVQIFLWGESNGEWGLEEWRRMFRKRVAKIDAIDENNPHAVVELKKRLLQTAALAVALIAVVERVGTPQRSLDAPPSNLPQFAKEDEA